jgi:two-component sensor histidine kinase
MSLVHEKLLSSGALTHVDLGDYLQSLAVDFSRTYSSDRIRFSSDGGPILLSVDKALPWASWSTSC